VLKVGKVRTLARKLSCIAEINVHAVRILDILLILRAKPVRVISLPENALITENLSILTWHTKF
jgi:hypothetical protein